MKTILLLALSLFAAQASSGQNCVKPIVGPDRGICAQLTVQFAELKRTSRLVGVVVDANGASIPEAIIEVFSGDEKGEIVATYRTDDSGRFCIKDLKTGKYRIKVGWSKFGFNCTEMRIEISGKTKRLLQVPLEIGH
ncbi:MAG: carboxypeptidase-like regulatory domain-containing protein [Pyrinomonadaceae bacterium]